MDTERTRDTLKKLLKPIARFGLRRSLSIHDFIAALKMALTEVAAEEITAAGETVNVSRLSVLTGMYRAELKTLYVEGIKPFAEPQSIIGRVIVQWEQDSRFRTSSGSPRVLSLDEFYSLVTVVTKAVHPASVLFELERNRAVERSARGYRLVRGTEILGQSEERAFDLVAKDIETVVEAASENIVPENEPGHLHHRTEFDNIFVDALPEIRAWILAEGRAFHRRIREFLACHDKDLSDKVNDTRIAGGRVSVTLSSMAEIEPGKPHRITKSKEAA